MLGDSDPGSWGCWSRSCGSPECWPHPALQARVNRTDRFNGENCPKSFQSWAVGTNGASVAAWVGLS